MKKIVIVAFICLTTIGIFCFLIQNQIFFKQHAKDPTATDHLSENISGITIQQVIEKFYKCKSIKWLTDIENNIIASSDNISVEINGNILSIIYDNINYDYTMENGILSTFFLNEDFYAGMILMALIDSVGQVHGYEDGATFDTLSSKEVEFYNLANGYERINNGVNISVKFDINKKLKLVDFSNTCIEISDLQDEIDNIRSTLGRFEVSRGDLVFIKAPYNYSIYDKEITFEIWERLELTDRAYKSVLNAIEVIFDKNERTSFSKQWPELKNVTLEKYKIELNPQGPQIENYKTIRITIDISK